MLSQQVQAQILALHYGQGRSVRAIARELGLNRRSIAAVIVRRQIRTSPAVGGPRYSMIDPHKHLIQEKLLRDPTVPATAIHQSLRRLGFTGSVRRLQEYLATVRVDPRPREAFLKLTFEPGETAQVDWGEFGDVFGDGRKIHAFVMVLCYSRKIYVEFTRSERFEDFIRAHERAFRFFGNRIPRECWYDNLASAVTERVGKLVRFNARFSGYMGHHGVTPYACTPASGNEKGRVEDGVKLIRSSFWADRKFANFHDLQAQCTDWLNNIANLREHRATRRVPALVFDHEEKQHLMECNPHPYDTDEIISKDVPPQFHLVLETNQYSVPWTLVGMVVTLRADDESVRIYYGGKLVASHPRSYAKHKIFTTASHQAGLLERKPGADHHTWQVKIVKEAGESLERYLKLVAAGQRSLRSEVKRLVALITIYGAYAVNEAAAELMVRGVVGVENLEMLLKAKGSEHRAPEPLQFQSSRLNRMTGTPDLSRYDALLFDEPTTTSSSSHSTEASHDDSREPDPRPDRAEAPPF